VDDGVPERVAVTITGHKTVGCSIATTIVSPRDLQEAVPRLTGTITLRGR